MSRGVPSQSTKRHLANLFEAASGCRVGELLREAGSKLHDDAELDNGQQDEGDAGQEPHLQSSQS